MDSELQIERVAVLGAGAMGSQIAALLANAGLGVDLLDVSEELARAGRERALKSRAFFLPEIAERVIPGSLEDLSCLEKADWTVEAIVEELGAKRELLGRVEEWARPGLVISTNTSGLSIAQLAAGRSALFCRHFMGIHFFNPPRHMKLVELIPAAQTDPALAALMRRFLEERLGKGVVECLDTPNFIANRLGVFALVDALRRLEEEGLMVEEVDAVTGPLLGRPRSATLRLCDLIGLDVLARVARTAFENLSASERPLFALPGFVEAMLARGLLGEKSRGGFYRREGERLQTLDLEDFTYRDLAPVDLGELDRAVRLPEMGDRLRAVWGDQGKLGRFARGHLLQVLNYAADHAAKMAGDLVQIDRAMRWGFNWEAGPFELWDLLGSEELPVLVKEVPPPGRFYLPGQVFSLREGRHVSREEEQGPLERGRALLRNDSASLVEVEEGIGVLVFQGKMNVITPQTLELVIQAAARPLRGLVLWGAGSLFSAGADLKHIAALSEAGQWGQLEEFLRRFQEAIMQLRFAPFPVVAAPRGLTLGGGCEFGLSVGARVAGAELHMGLVESRVGLIPGAGGCKEMARRQGPKIAPAFRMLLAGQFSENALQARQWGMLDEGDGVVMGEDRVLEAALERVRGLASGYARPQPAAIPVPGEAGREELEHWLKEQGEALAPHDRMVGLALARVLCGGEGPAREVDEQRLLDLEREEFLGLCGTQATRARIEHLLKTGKPLRN